LFFFVATKYFAWVDRDVLEFWEIDWWKRLTL